MSEHNEAAGQVSGALTGIRVVDCTMGLSGPEATRLLAEAGAEVVKVESPAGDIARGTAGFETWNRSKAAMVLDLRNPRDIGELDRLLAGADVFVHGFRPHLARALGLDDDALRTRHPHLIVSAVTGYPSHHPDADRPGWDILVQARTGAMWEVDGARPGPIFLRLPVPSWATCYLVAAGILARLLARSRTGEVAVAHTSLMQGMLTVLTMLWHRGERLTPEMKAKLPLPKGFPAPAMSMFQCQDGAWIQVMPGYLEHPLVIESVAELGESIDVETAYPIPSIEELTVLREAFAGRPSTEWLPAFWDGGYPAEAVRTIGTVFTDPQAIENDYIVEFDHPDLGTVRQAAAPYASHPAARVYGPAPELGATPPHSLDWAPRNSDGHAETAEKRLPLDGLRILDLGMFLAGPLATMLFADMGADVIKVEPPTGDRMRHPTQVALFVGCQRGKRSVVLDLTDPASRPVFKRLVRWADVIHHNLRGSAARALGVDYESLHAINPTAVYCHVSAYGESGHKADWPGYDPLAQAMSGWTVASTPLGTKPMWYRFGLMDHLTAMASMVPTLMALLRRERTGAGSFVSASLLATAVETNSETYACLPSGHCAPIAQIDSDQTGLSPYYRIYRTADERWLAVAAMTDQAQSTLRDVLACGADGFETAFNALSVSDAAERLRAAGVPCEAVREDWEQAFFESAPNRDAGLIASYQHADFGAFEQPGAFWDFGIAPRFERPPPALGQHTREVLAEFGLTTDEIDDLTGRGPGASRDQSPAESESEHHV